MVRRMLTNYKTISQRIDRLNEIRNMETDGTFDAQLRRSIKVKSRSRQARKYLGGIKDMDGLPEQFL